MILNVDFYLKGVYRMWVSVDRIEGQTVVLCGDDDKEYRLSVEVYSSLCGRSPRESDMLDATEVDGAITSLSYSEEETVKRTQAARARLRRLFNRT
jgi:hypothetical protein